MNIIITEEQFQKVLETLKEEKTMNEKIVLDVNVGDTVMMGKFKNKKTLVKKIDKDEHGMPTINGKKAATFRIPKKVEIKEEINQEPIITITDKIKDILDDETDEKIGEKKYKSFDIRFTDGARSFGTIYNNIGYITKIEAPKIDGITPIRNTKTYQRVLIELYKLGVKTIVVKLQSSDSRQAISKLMNKGILTNPREITGISVDEHPSKFDINIDNLKKDLFNESISINEVKSNEVDLSSFEEQKKLNDKIWKEDKSLNPKVRRRLIKIADDFLDNIEVDNKLVEDTMFLGSLAGYNWSKYSDIDLHILMDFKKINKDTKLVKDYFDSKKKIWSNEHDSLKIYGFPVEIYIQDINEKNNSIGKYSIENNEWLEEPKPSDKEIDENKIKSKAADLMTSIDKLEKSYNKDLSDEKLTQLSNDVKKIYDKIKQLRKSGLEKNGEFSVGNIVFKVLRRTNYIKKLIDLKIKTYDIINSLK